MQRYRLLVQAYDAFRGAMGLFVQRQHVLHRADVLRGQLCHAPHLFPAKTIRVLLESHDLKPSPEERGCV